MAARLLYLSFLTALLTILSLNQTQAGPDALHDRFASKEPRYDNALNARANGGVGEICTFTSLFTWSVRANDGRVFRLME